MIREQGFLSLWKGNITYSLKIFTQLTCKAIFVDRFKHQQEEAIKFMNKFKYKIIGLRFFLTFVNSFFASLITLAITYPFDMAYTRLAAQMQGKNIKFDYKNLNDCFHNQQIIITKNMSSNEIPTPNFFNKFFVGFPLAFYESLLFSTVTLTGYQILYNYIKLTKNDNESHMNKYIRMFGASSLIALIASTVAYPLDTVKRQMQVNGAKGFKNEFRYSSDALQKVINKGRREAYAGFSMHMVRTIPFSFIQFQIFSLMTKTIKQQKE